MYLSIAIPSSFTSNLSSLTQKTITIANLARACAIYRVNKIYIYRDPITKGDARFISKLLKYFVTPPYLRKLIYPQDRDLSYVGIAPPIRIDLFKDWEAIRDLKLPQIRLGLVVKTYKDRSILDVGLDKEVAVKGKYVVGYIYPVLMEKAGGKYIWGRVLTDDETMEMDVYPGYKVVIIRESLPSFLKRYEGMVIGTSRYGDYIGDVLNTLRNELPKSKNILLVFGAPQYGLAEILEHYNLKPKNLFKYYLNMVWMQGVDTIRLEEAVIISLSLINLLLNSKDF